MDTQEAVRKAKSVGLDLVEVSTNARPPVCKIVDYGKYKYDQKKLKKEQPKKVHRLKEVKFRVGIEAHDYMTKIRRSEKFLHQGNKLKITLMFRGREMEHIDVGMKVVRRAIDDLSAVGRPDDEPKLSGRFIMVNLSPLPETQRVLKYNTAEEAEVEEVDEEVEDEETAGEEESAQEETIGS